MLDLEERSDDLPALMVWCDVVAKSEVFSSFISYDSCSVSRSRIVRVVSVVAYCEVVGWDKLETERNVWDKNPLGNYSVADPNPDPSDPYVFRPPGSGSSSRRYGS